LHACLGGRLELEDSCTGPMAAPMTMRPGLSTRSPCGQADRAPACPSIKYDQHKYVRAPVWPSTSMAKQQSLGDLCGMARPGQVPTLASGKQPDKQRAVQERWRKVSDNQSAQSKWSKNQKESLDETQASLLIGKFPMLPLLERDSVDEAVADLNNKCVVGEGQGICILRTTVCHYILWTLGNLQVARQHLGALATLTVQESAHDIRASVSTHISSSEDDFPLGMEAHMLQASQLPDIQIIKMPQSPTDAIQEATSYLFDEIDELKQHLSIQETEKMSLVQEKQQLSAELGRARSRSRSRADKYRQQMLRTAHVLEQEAAAFEAKAVAFRQEAARIRAEFGQQ